MKSNCAFFVFLGIVGTLTYGGCDTDDLAEKKVSDLTQFERNEACNLVRAPQFTFGQNAHKLLCMIEALTVAEWSENPDRCQTRFENCLDQDETDGVSITEGSNCPFLTQETTSCQAKVGQFVRCFEDKAKQIEKVSSTLSCSGGDTQDLALSLEQLPKSCEQLTEQCPLFFDGCESCQDRECGEDPVCGVNCGSCANGYVCAPDGQCIAEVDPSKVDILFVVDNSRWMLKKQLRLAESIYEFTDALDSKAMDYQIAVVSTSIMSEGCNICTGDNYSCNYEQKDLGNFHEYLGSYLDVDEEWTYQYNKAPQCRVVTSHNKDCLYDQDLNTGTLMTGNYGCGYERGLQSILETFDRPENKSFIRPEATLLVVVVSDEEDCGDPDDIDEFTDLTARLCYYAAKGVPPERHPLYTLKSVDSYYNSIVDLKGSSSVVKFAAIVGLTDANNPEDTTIEFENEKIKNACSMPNCEGHGCNALPGTRYVTLASKFILGVNGFVDTICQNDFSQTMRDLAAFATK